jgi:hypothetical protein
MTKEAFESARWWRALAWHASCPTEEIPNLDTLQLPVEDCDSPAASQSNDVTRETATKVNVEIHECIAAGHSVLAAAEVFDQKRRRRRDRA